MNDITSQQDLVVLVDTFYASVRKDEILGPLFDDAIGEDWSLHLPIMYAFWNTTLFGEAGYKGQAIGKHIELDRKIPLQPAHFDQWISYWNQTVDHLFTGANATKIKEKALTMLKLIQYKVETARTGKSLL